MNLNDNFNLSLRFVRKGPSGETLRFHQTLDGIPVFGSDLVVHYSPSGELTHTDLKYEKNVGIISTTPRIQETDAIQIADRELKVSGLVTYQEIKLFVKVQESGTNLVYRVVTSFETKPGSWEVFLDAQSGTVLSVKDIAIYCGGENHDGKSEKIELKSNSKSKYFLKSDENMKMPLVAGSGMVFAADPLSSAHVAYGGNYVDGSGAGDVDTAELNAQRINVVLPEIENNSGTYKLKSSYVEIRELENPNKGLFTQTNTNFSFTRSQDGFEATNVFYHTDASLRYINETLGVNCIQNVDNSHAGILWFDPSGENGADNSHYSNGVLVFGEGCVDDGEDADVIWHELGHGLHDWMTGGSLSQVNGLSEGCGDYWAQSHSRALNHWASADAAYQWVFNWDGHNTCWGGRSTGVTSLYPGGLVNQIHTDGQIWATTLMKIWGDIGRQKMDKAFLEGLALTNSSTNQPNAAIAVRQAAIDMNYPCADIQAMTTRFTAVGYTMPALTTKVNCPANKTVTAGVGNTYTVPSYVSETNVISANCTATATQNPAVGTSLAPGTYTVTMTANPGTANCTFQLLVEPYLGTEDFVKHNIKIFPNPASSEITISGDLISDQTITIYNLLGQKVEEAHLNSDINKINVSRLAKGVYTMYFEKFNATYKFVKE